MNAMINKYLSAFILCLFVSLSISSVQASDEKTMEIVVVQKDNLFNLCGKLLTNPNKCNKVMSLNRLINPDLILPGQKLKFAVKDLRGMPMDGRVTMLRGTASIRDKQSEKWRVLLIDDRIIKGSSVKTGKDGIVEITFEDGTSLIMRQDTALVLNESSRYGLMHMAREFFLETGRTISRLQEITGRNSRYEIRTPSAVAAARGTVFRVAVDEKETTRSEVLEGVVNVKTASHEVEVKKGDGTLAKKDGALLKPRKLLEPPGLIEFQTLYRTIPLRFRFSKIEGATSYRIALTRDMNGNDIIQEKVIRPDETMQIIGIDDGTYFLQSQSIDIDGLEGQPSDPVTIKVRINPLPPIIQSPALAARLRETSVDIKWLNVPDAVKYRIQLAEDPEFSRIVKENADIRTAVYRVEPLDVKTYYFRVSSIAEDGFEGVSSDIQSFTVVPVPPSPPLEKPALDDREIRLRWSDLGEGITYRLQIATDPEFNNIVTDRKIEKPAIALQRFKEHGTYYVRTQGIDAEGYAGGFSPPQSFEIKRGFLYETLGIIGVIGLIVILAL